MKQFAIYEYEDIPFNNNYILGCIGYKPRRNDNMDRIDDSIPYSQAQLATWKALHCTGNMSKGVSISSLLQRRFDVIADKTGRRGIAQKAWC